VTLDESIGLRHGELRRRWQRWREIAPPNAARPTAY
jgi:hypothetical protein